MNGWAAVVASVYFATVAAGYAVQAVGAQYPARRVHELIHVVMGIAMAVMPWPVWMDLPAIWPIMFFTAAATWYVFTLVGGRHGEHGPLAVIVHAVMSVAMVWMAVAMTPMVPTAVPGMSESMPGMHMPAPSSAGVRVTGATGWGQAVTAVVLTVLIAGAIAQLVITARHRRATRVAGPGGRWAGPALDTGMAAGMAIVLALLTG